MKFLFLVLLLVFPVDAIFAESPIGIYEFYKESVDNFCKPTDPALWSNWKDNSFLKQEQVFYADITKKDDGDKEYKRYLSAIKADPSQIDSFQFSLKPAFLEKASYVYKETMGTIYACAVINTKIRIINNLLMVPTTQSNLKKKLKGQLSYMRGRIDPMGCREVTNTSEFSLRKSLLDNTTYQYCNYRQYLHYLDYTSKNTLNTYYASKNTLGAEDKNPLKDTSSVAIDIAISANKIVSEIAHTKEVFPQAMVAYTEFEKTYASHIILEFILQDYIDLRDSLKKLLNPIGQVIYKASNAQSPK